MNRQKNQLTQHAALEALHEKLFEAARQRRIGNPSAGERALQRGLKALGVAYEREHRLASSLYSVTFFIKSAQLGIDVKDKPSRLFKRRDQMKRKKALCLALGIDLIRIDGAELDDDAFVQAWLRELLGIPIERAA